MRIQRARQSNNGDVRLQPQCSMKLSNQQFDRTHRLASRWAGIALVERHHELLERRSERLGIRDDGGLDSLLSAAESGEAAAVQKFLCLLTTKFTGFFRHPSHFELAARHALRVVHRCGRQGPGLSGLKSELAGAL